MVDPGFSESVAVADFNKDGRLDILSAEYWYEAPTWTKHKIRDIPFNGSYIDNFSDLPLDVDGDGYTDVVQIAYFARQDRLAEESRARDAVPGSRPRSTPSVRPSSRSSSISTTTAKPRKCCRSSPARANAPLSWYEVQNGKWVKHVVSSQSYGHGIGAGDVNGDKRNDILTPQGWLEAPADVRAPGDWTFHATDWSQLPPVRAAGPAAAAGAAPAPQPPARPAEYAFMYVIDVNKDGRSDVVTSMAHSYGVLWFEQTADGQWVRRMIDSTWANAHSSAMADLNGDGQLDLVAAKRYFGRTGNDPAEREPMGIYWYQFRPGRRTASSGFATSWTTAAAPAAGCR